MGRETKEIAFYQRKISVYNARRLRYKKMATKLSSKVIAMRKQIKFIRKRNDKIQYLINALIDHYGYHPLKNKLVLGAYFKWGMENNINGKFLKDYISIKDNRLPSAKRKQFTQLIQKDKTANQQYHSFIKKMKQGCK